jgi:hypothetical protein
MARKRRRTDPGQPAAKICLLPSYLLHVLEGTCDDEQKVRKLFH